MASKLSTSAFRVRRRVKSVLDTVLGWLAVVFLRIWRLSNRKRLANGSGWFMRRLGPWLPEHRIGRANLAAAYPDKSSAEVEQILNGVWDNLGRVGAEFPHLDRLRVMDLADPAKPADITFDEVTVARFQEIHRVGRPTLFFAAHLANWELPALCAAHFKLDSCVLFRPPNIRAVADAILRIRAGCMGTLVPSNFGAPMRLAHALEAGQHVGMLVDQYEFRGTDVTFFGRSCKVTPLLGQLARHLECPIRGTRAIRQPDRNSFRVELTEALELPRDADGRIDIAKTMQLITTIIEGWVREHPEQWLWLHRRWR
jgi:KDO2-lipid IV(A) lauroyltransferase